MSSNPENELASRLGQGLDSIKSAIPVVLGGIAVLVVGSIAWGLYSSGEKKKQALAWTDFYFTTEEGGAQSFSTLAESYPESNMAGWAQLAAADDHLYEGVELMYRNRSLATDELEKAKEGYKKAVEVSNDEEQRSKAVLGLARVHESLGELDEAVTHYEEFTGLNTVPALNQMVADRLAFIKSDDGRAFYDWFSKLDPKPADPINLPSDLSLPPTGPSMSFGPTDPLNLPALSEEDAGGESSEAPAATSEEGEAGDGAAEQGAAVEATETAPSGSEESSADDETP